jgi:thiol-disulfide isomerase/thioredoxin
MAGAVQRLKLPGQAMQLKGKMVDGSPFDLAGLKGKVVLVDYWATWCGPCIAEMPTLRKLHEKYKTQGFEIVGVSIDEDRPALEEFLASRKLPWIVVHDAENDGQHPSVEKYGILATPTKILIGKDGKVVDVAVTISRLEDLLKEHVQ